MLVLVAGAAATIAVALLFAPIPPIPKEKPGDSDSGAHSGQLLLYCLALFLYIGVEGCIGGWSGKYAASIGNGSTYVTASLVAFWGALLSGRAVAALVLRYVRDMMLLWMSLLATAAGLGLFWIAGSGPMIVIAALVAGLGLAPVFALLLSLMTQFAESADTHIPGWLFSLGSMGGAALPWLFGVTSAYFGQPRLGFLVPSFGTACLFVFALFETRRQRWRFQETTVS
jgi:fucose permease